MRIDAVFGPTAGQIRLMGDKATARRTMADVGVPIIPGTPGPVEDVDEALGFARDIGFPVIIKAAAGGGGKGMRVANDADDFSRAFQLARSEALSAFGSGDVCRQQSDGLLGHDDGFLVNHRARGGGLGRCGCRFDWLGGLTPRLDVVQALANERRRSTAVKATCDGFAAELPALFGQIRIFVHTAHRGRGRIKVGLGPDLVLWIERAT